MVPSQQRLVFALLVLQCFLSVTTSAFSINRAAQSSIIRRRSSRAALPSRVEEDSSIDISPQDTLTQENGGLPTVLQLIVDERLEFNMNLGKAMDTLRKDIPEILRSSPDYSIYHPEISVIDPSGVRLTGLDNYKSSMAFFQTFITFWFSPSSSLQYRMVYDFCRSSIRVSWNLVLIPKVPLGRPLFLDGISHYKLDASSGKVVEHKIENLVMNDTPVAPPYGIMSLLQQEMGQRQPVPVAVGAGAI